MNTVYLSILRVNITRFFRSSTIESSFIIFFLWLLSFCFLCIFTRWPEISIIFIYVTCFYLFYHNSIFWSAWVEANKNPFAGLDTGKKIKDRFCVPFMSCLPVNRKRLYAVQVLFYIMLSAAVCIISFMIQIIFPQARSHLNFTIYMHFLMFILLIMSGGLYSVLILPDIFRGEMKYLKDLASILSVAFIFFCALLCVVLLTKDAMGQYLIKIENFLYIIDRPFVLLIPLATGIFMFWLGSIIFKSIDIR